MMEEEYFEAIARHKEGAVGRRGVDMICKMFATMVDAMTRTDEDLLGDLFEGAITYGERGQFLTPEPICDLMCRMNLPSEKTDLEGRRSVNDPCCVSPGA